MSLCDKLKRDVPQVHMSRILSIHKHAVLIHVDIDVKLKTPEHEIIGEEIDNNEDVGTVDKHARSEDEYRCRDDDACFGSVSGDQSDDDDAFVPLRSVFLFLSIA